MENKNSGGGIGFCGALTLIFITLKLLKVINWSWWWVLCPVWIGILFWVIVVIIIIMSQRRR